jgi:hypothetical protein
MPPLVAANASARPVKRQIRKINIDGQAWHVPNEHIDGSATFECKAFLFSDMRYNLEQ